MVSHSTQTYFLLIPLVFWLTQSLDEVGAQHQLVHRTKRQSNDVNTTVLVEQGLLQGQQCTTIAREPYFCFRGIPYAKPPVGDLRFKDAETPESWEGVRQAFVEGNVCPQPTSLDFLTIFGSEDCLYLNVYTPNIPPLDGRAFPVMVFIHGGAFVGGAGTSFFFGPDFLVQEDVIMVAMNYRLGALGFMYLEEAAPGNVGLKDQVAALRWVQRNIAAFGGDPRRVTIFGQSAGSVSVHLHVLSPMSKGLFYAAIAQSGNALNKWADMTAPLETSRRLATAVGCPVGNNTATVECLRGVDVGPLIQAAFTEALTDTDRGRIVPFSFVPTVDYPVSGVEVFLPETPTKMVTRGRYHSVPFLTGFNNNESLLHAGFVNFFDENVAYELDNSWNTTILPELRLCENDSRNEQALQDLRDFYMKGLPLTNATIPGFMEMITDIAFAEGVYFTLRYMAKYNKSPLYEYHFIIHDALNYGLATGEFQYLGASHGDDLGYLFRIQGLAEPPANSSAYIERARMVRMWTNFAKYRNPTPIYDSLLNVQWKQYTEYGHNFLEIGTELRSKRNLNARRVAFWKRFYRTYGCHRV